MHRISINAVATLLWVVLGGCAAPPQKLLPHDNTTMQDVWNQYTAGQDGKGHAAQRLLDARRALRRPLTSDDAQSVRDINSAYTRTAANEIYSQFKRLPNPDLMMYVFPHLTGTDPTPVPGYTTVFPFYSQVHYAMPGDRTEDF